MPQVPRQNNEFALTTDWQPLALHRYRCRSA
jgi:hypothetical protein